MGHHHFKVSRKARLRAVIAISFCFFLAEVSVGFYTHSIALVADAFHYVSAVQLPVSLEYSYFHS